MRFGKLFSGNYVNYNMEMFYFTRRGTRKSVNCVLNTSGSISSFVEVGTL